jgi:5-formyltetrahydrofolate cyclo-ligase
MASRHRAHGDFLIPEVLLLPVNGFDAAGYRIGYGGGYFDRTLASLCRDRAGGGGRIRTSPGWTAFLPSRTTSDSTQW